MAAVGDFAYETEPATINYDTFGNEISMDLPDPLSFFPRYAKGKEFVCGAKGMKRIVRTAVSIQLWFIPTLLWFSTIFFPESLKKACDHWWYAIKDGNNW